MQQKTDELFIKACAANETHGAPSKHELHSKCISDSVLCGKTWPSFEQMQMAPHKKKIKIILAAVLNYIFSLFVMLDFKRLSAVDSTRVCESRFSGLLSAALMGWLGSVAELNCYQLFIIRPITSISAPICDLPATGGLFVRISSMETYMLIGCLSSSKAFNVHRRLIFHISFHTLRSDISRCLLTVIEKNLASFWTR